MQDRIDQFIVERIKAGSKSLYADVLAWMERFIIVYILRLTKGNQTRAAELLGITRGSLRFKIRTRGIRIGQIVATPMEGHHVETPVDRSLTDDEAQSA